ncbi:MAG: hypothetical protein IRY95_02385, partial [Clostridia bacterium]|nr:hypothetical protein [Clostridia bacterium]
MMDFEHVPVDAAGFPPLFRDYLRSSERLSPFFAWPVADPAAGGRALEPWRRRAAAVDEGKAGRAPRTQVATA